MKKILLGSLISLIIIVVIIFSSIIGEYNKLQIMDENINSNWAQVENQLKRRSDLVPNLVNTVKGYANLEKEVFTNIANARSKLAGAIKTDNVKDISTSNQEFTSALSRLLVVIENYPQLKADKSFIALSDELAGTENRIAVARLDYNNSVKVLNAKIRTFPSSIIANFSNIKARDYFEADEASKEVPKVEF